MMPSDIAPSDSPHQGLAAMLHKTRAVHLRTTKTKFRDHSPRETSRPIKGGLKERPRTNTWSALFGALLVAQPFSAWAKNTNSCSLIDLGTLGGTQSQGNALNHHGQVTGYAYTTVQSHAFLYSNGTMLDLGTLGG